MRWIGMAGAIVLLVAGFVALGLTSDFVVDWLWFSAVGYREVFWTIFTTKASLFSAAFIGSTIPVWVSGMLALRYARRRGPWLPVVPGRPSKPVRTWSEIAPEPVAQRFPQLPWRWLIAGIAVVIGVLIAEVETAKWGLVLRFLHQVPYGQHDPLFGKDFSFYLFSLPALLALKNWVLLVLDLSVVVAAAVYWAHGDIELAKGRQGISSAAIVHGSVLLGLFFVVMAWSYGLDRFLLLYGDNGVVVGAGYTDIHVELPVLWALVGIASVAALVSWANVWRRTYTLPLAAVVLVFGSSFALDWFCQLSGQVAQRTGL